MLSVCFVAWPSVHAMCTLKHVIFVKGAWHIQGACLAIMVKPSLITADAHLLGWRLMVTMMPISP